MWRAKLNFDKFDWTRLRQTAATAIVMTGCCVSVAMAQGQKSFSSPADASSALFKAMQGNDEKALLDILGPDGKQIVSSGDATEDANNRANFVRRYEEMHRLMKEPNGTTTVYIGARNWPLPIPIVGSGKSWHFDTEAGKKEILYRRVGKNEISTIHVCHELVAAQKEYYSEERSHYAEKIFSDNGQHNGLYWKAAGSEPKSPIGPLVASAVAEGYVAGGSGPSTPYRGYYYHILTGQGKNAPGGAKSYLVDGKMTGGFAFVAYPAEYRSSGVMTFIVSQEGVVYEKDLGKKTSDIANAMKEYNPDSSWSKSEDAQEKAAAARQAK
jgi:Protein of unknown function (DUF2950)